MVGGAKVGVGALSSIPFSFSALFLAHCFSTSAFVALLPSPFFPRARAFIFMPSIPVQEYETPDVPVTRVFTPWARSRPV
jgi:hypothetical protein